VSARLLAVDVAIAVVIAALIMIISPGIAVTGMLAVLVLFAIGVSYAWSMRRR
jgi:hypothetical protein